MFHNRARNVNDAYYQGISLLSREGKREPSRAGDVLVLPAPLVTDYSHPQERVLLNPKRDANPAFHFFEFLWMMMGRDDAEFLNQFVKDFGSRFAEPNGTIHDAYGFRWRNTFGFNQLTECTLRLKDNPYDRQAVITMWDPRIENRNDLKGNWVTRPCNTHIYLRNNNGRLDMTVCCRSNDMIWGAYGSNAVHFSMLQEYLAGRIGIPVGFYYQISNNFHAYVDIFEKFCGSDVEPEEPYAEHAIETVPIGNDYGKWTDDLFIFMSCLNKGVSPDRMYYNKWFNDVAVPMYLSHHLYRQGEISQAIEETWKIKAFDWQIAMRQWFERRVK